MNLNETPPGFSFQVSHSARDSRARTGRLQTPHGAIDTPAFVFCATKAAIKGVLVERLQETDTQIILSNTYHLMLQPGAAVIAGHGGLHRFTGWSGPMLTDSGGFQIFSLGHGSVADEIKGRRTGQRESLLLGIDPDGATFRSYLDGSVHRLGPEESIQVQRRLGADIILTFDECSPFHVDRAYTERSMALSHDWADRCLAELARTDGAFAPQSGSAGPQALYGIVQGGVYDELRAVSAAFVNERPFFGAAIGGCLGGNREQMMGVVDMASRRLRPERPVHLLGIGEVADVFDGVAMGIDTFDCVQPTRIARHGMALMRGVPGGRINLNNAVHRNDTRPLDPSGASAIGLRYSRAYVHHLIKAKEMIGPQILAEHNIAFMNRLMAEVRQAIRDDTLAAARQAWLGAPAGGPAASAVSA
ncbi:MAG: tRNA guanosine(34) transglycosylase Tgt [Alphaproteobacteria bacterium]